MFFSKNEKLVKKKKALFMAKWECQDLRDVKEFLCMRIMCTRSGITTDQCDYLEKVLNRLQLTDAKAAITPLLTNWEPKANTGKATTAEITCYQSMIGSLLYLMIGTHPDIAFAVTHLSQFGTNPTKDHYKAAQHVCCYLVGTHDYKLVYTQEEDKGLVAFTNSDWAADKIQQRSVTGYFFKLANGIILWRSHAQKTLIKEFGIKIRSIPIYGDNQGSIFIANNTVQESHTKHINICYHYICELVVAKEVELQFVPGEMNPTNMFTKNLQKIKFTQF